MLVLTRKKKESIIIGDDIKITVVKIRGDKVRLGIEAPREITVYRKEVYDEIRRKHPEEPRREATAVPQPPPIPPTPAGEPPTS